MAEQKQATKAVDVQYIVKRAFKYNGEVLTPGSEFVPVGAKNDWKIINQGNLVTRIESLAGAPHRRTKKRG